MRRLLAAVAAALSLPVALFAQGAPGGAAGGQSSGGGQSSSSGQSSAGTQPSGGGQSQGATQGAQEQGGAQQQGGTQQGSAQSGNTSQAAGGQQAKFRPTIPDNAQIVLVQNVDPNQKKILACSGGGEKVDVTVGNAEITDKGGQPKQLADIKPGSRLLVVYNGPKKRPEATNLRIETG